MNIPPWLLELGIPDECISSSSSASESGRTFSIKPSKGDQIWRIKFDGCWRKEAREKRVDYLFWVQAASGQKFILLVELKGQNFGKALEQVEATLKQLCKKADGQGIHTGPHLQSPGHNLTKEGGIRAYIVLSRGKGVPQRLAARERLRKRFNVSIQPKSQRLEIKGVAALP